MIRAPSVFQSKPLCQIHIGRHCEDEQGRVKGPAVAPHVNENLELGGSFAIQRFMKLTAKVGDRCHGR